MEPIGALRSCGSNWAFQDTGDEVECSRTGQDRGTVWGWREGELRVELQGAVWHSKWPYHAVFLTDHVLCHLEGAQVLIHVL